MDWMIPIGTPLTSLIKSRIVTPGAKMRPKIFRKLRTDSAFCSSTAASDFLPTLTSGFCLGTYGTKMRTRMTLMRDPMAARSEANCSLKKQY